MYTVVVFSRSVCWGHLHRWPDGTDAAWVQVACERLYWFGLQSVVCMD